MSIEQIRGLCDAEPFQPFIIHLPDGRNIPVNHPDFVAFAPSGRLISVFHEDNAQSIVDLLLVSDVTLKTSGSAGAERPS